MKGVRPKQQNSSVDEVIESDCVHYSSIEEWLRHCERHHLSSCCRQASKRTMETITVIDCRTSMLCEIQSRHPYIALSYLWGSDSLYEPSVQGRLPRQLPKTIADSMTVALALNIPYLWIDRYCINQEDSREKARIIRHMDQIYRDAYLTIIASAGESPTHGLPGVENTPRQSLESNRIVVGPYVFCPPGDVSSNIRRSMWNTRGWTYQEGLLSRRRLVFTESGVYFQCLDMVCLE
ncbi:HET-domain-containing protein, partial [Karstenula rhodostoma CBS 690.94]